jgi:hypothetical protein
MITDRWLTRDQNGTTRPTPAFGRGSRWEAGYRDQPGGHWKRRRFHRRKHAERFELDMAAVRRADLLTLAGAA